MKTIILILSIFFATSCSNDDDIQADQSTPINFTEIGKGYTGLNDNSSQNLFITTEAEWNNLLNYLPNDVVDDFNETNVNFNEYNIIAIISQNQPDTGHSLCITNIEENDNTVFIFSEIQNSGSGFTAIVQPFHIVKMPKTDKTIEFE